MPHRTWLTTPPGQEPVDEPGGGRGPRRPPGPGPGRSRLRAVATGAVLVLVLVALAAAVCLIVTDGPG